MKRSLSALEKIAAPDNRNDMEIKQESMCPMYTIHCGSGSLIQRVSSANPAEPSSRAEPCLPLGSYVRPLRIPCDVRYFLTLCGYMSIGDCKSGIQCC